MCAAVRAEANIFRGSLMISLPYSKPFFSVVVRRGGGLDPDRQKREVGRTPRGNDHEQAYVT